MRRIEGGDTTANEPMGRGCREQKRRVSSDSEDEVTEPVVSILHLLLINAMASLQGNSTFHPLDILLTHWMFCRHLLFYVFVVF